MDKLKESQARYKQELLKNSQSNPSQRKKVIAEWVLKYSSNMSKELESCAKDRSCLMTVITKW